MLRTSTRTTSHLAWMVLRPVKHSAFKWVACFPAGNTVRLYGEHGATKPHVAGVHHQWRNGNEAMGAADLRLPYTNKKPNCGTIGT